jgi:ornithine carbamoyltransferase
VALLFEKPSARTRVSTEMAVWTLGGHPVTLRNEEVGLGTRETPADLARTLACFCSIVAARVNDHAALEEMAAAVSATEPAVPVVNLLSDRAHPCQAFADLLTLRELLGSLEGRRLVFVGDGNNVARSLAILGTLAGMHVAVASPDGYSLEDGISLPEGASGLVTLHSDPREAVRDARAIYTDVWVSMGDEADAPERREALADYRVDDALLDAGAPGAFAMHDLPAHPGEEISAEVLYGERQRIWDQAENRRHAQKALLELLVAGPA